MRKKIKVISRFQSTFPRGERRWQYTVTRGVSDFNPRSLVGNDYTLPSFIIQFNYFNPRSLVGNDGKDSGQEKGGYISIHVPSWGTTMEKPLSYPNQQISIHVPSWGTTRSLFDLPFPLPISIHVPSWGTTSMLAGCGKAYPFQSTFPRGERLYSSRNLYHC